MSNCQGDLNRLLCLSRWPLLCTLSTLSFIEWSVTAESLLSANIASKRTFFSPRDHKQLQQSTNWCSSISTREYECSQQINCIHLILICISQYEATSPLRFTLHFFDMEMWKKLTYLFPDDPHCLSFNYTRSTVASIDFWAFYNMLS